MISSSDFYQNNFDAIERFAKSQDPNIHLGNNTPLGLAAVEGKLKTVKCLVSHGADPNFADPRGWTPLLYAANDGRVSVIRYLLSIGADVKVADAQGQTALHHLCYCPRRSNLEAATLLLAAGADPAATNLQGQLPVDVAASNKDRICNHDELARLLAPA